MKKLIIALIAALAVSGVAEARKVSGKVISGKENLKGVIVTDGEHFTQTKKSGKFSFEINDDAEFVYIVTPAGYAADWLNCFQAPIKKPLPNTNTTGVDNNHTT